MIIVSGQNRCGTSMMMDILHRGGFNVIKGIQDEKILKTMRNPNGLYEGKFPENPQEPFAFKCFNMKEFDNIVSKYPCKVIFMTRKAEEIYASWREVMKNRERQPLVGKEQRIKAIKLNRERWEDKVKGQKILKLDYDWVCQNPDEAIDMIADFVEIPFDKEKARKGIDTTHYINRNVII